MAVSTGMSFVLASISSVLFFSGIQMYKPWFLSSQIFTIFGGYLGSILFLLSLTAVGNLETCVFGKSFHIKIFPEVSFCLILSVLTAATIHRVCATTCLIISLCSLYYINKYSQKVHASVTAATFNQSGKKKK